MAATEKLAVVLFNLGGPAAASNIQPFLFNFFMDGNILQLPRPLRYFVARWISWSRGRGASKEAYGHLGGVSPLLANTQAQALALETALQGNFAGARVFVSMRYWHPLARQTVQEVASFHPDKIILLPLYPQFSTATSRSSLQDWHREARRYGLRTEDVDICCYPLNPGFIAASVDLVRGALAEAPKKTRVLFSAHGLPEKMIRQGDPYQYQCEQTARAIVQKLNIPLLDWKLCYQSKIGRLRWTGPSVSRSLEEAADDQVGVVIYPLAFVSEHVETLVEIDIEYRHRARSMGIPYFAKVPTVGTHPAFISGLRDIVLSRARGMACEKVCPEHFKKCHHGVEND